MLRSFIRFTETSFDPETDNNCLSDPDDILCGEGFYEYELPAVAGDVIKWQMLEEQIPTDIYSITDYKIGVVSCGSLVAANVGSIIEAGNGILQCTANIPNDIEEGCYQFIIYADFTPFDCSIYEGSVLQDLIDSGVLLGDVLDCIPVPDWV